MQKKQAIRLPKKIPFSKDGYEKVKNDLEAYIQKRPQAVISLRTAREMGDLSENGAYKAARFELSDIDRNIRRLTHLVRFGIVVEKKETDYVTFGSKVTLSDGKKELSFELVGGYESDPLQKKLSVVSPIGKAVLNKRKGDRVEVETPKGIIEYTILDLI